ALALLAELLRLAARRLPFAREVPLGLPQPLDRRFRLRFLQLPPAPGFSEDLPRAAEQCLRETLLPRHGEGPAAARETGMEPVIGPARFLVELHGRADGIRPTGGEVLERREVRRDERAAPAGEVLLQESDRERAPFFRVRRAADLVDQGEAAGARVAQDRRERFHRGRERRSAG